MTPDNHPGAGDVRAAMLHAATYLDASLDAQIDGDEAELLRNLETLGGLVAAITGQLRGSSCGTLSATSQ
jgi:hypothetical protein